MKLSAQDVNLFFKLMRRLQLYVNREKEILPNVDSVEAYSTLPTGDKLEMRNALWENPELIDAYVAENPDQLSADELEIVQKWKRFVSGRMQIFRYLKKHAIFIHQDSRVYGVLGLQDDIKDVMYRWQVPVMVQAVLLPFKGKIIYDGMLSPYSIHFGPGIRSSLNEVYMAAKQNGRIITTLEPELAKPAREKRKRSAQDWGSAVDDLVQMASKMKGGPAIQSAAFSLLRASAQLAQSAVHDPDDLDKLWDQERKVRRALTRLQTMLNRAEM